MSSSVMSSQAFICRHVVSCRRHVGDMSLVMSPTRRHSMSARVSNPFIDFHEGFFWLAMSCRRPSPTRTMSTTLWPGHPTPPNSRRLFSNTLATIWLARFIVAARLAGVIRRSRRLSCFSVRIRPLMGRRIILLQVMLYNQDPDGFGTYRYRSFG